MAEPTETDLLEGNERILAKQLLIGACFSGERVFTQ